MKNREYYLLRQFYDHQPNYQDKYRFFCTHNACCQELLFYNVPYADLYLNCSVDISLFIDDSSENFLPFYIQMDTSPFIHNKYFSYTVCADQEDIQRVWEDNKRIINEGVPIIIGVDQYYLPYHMYFQKNHGAHAIFLCGFDERNHQAYILDSDRTGTFRGTIDLDALNNARLSKNSWNGNINSGGNIKGVTLKVLLNNFHETPYDLFKLTVEKMVESYYKKKSENPKILVGHDAIQFVFQWYTEQVHSFTSNRKHFMELYTALLPSYEKKTLFLNYLSEIMPLFCTIAKDSFSCMKKCVDLWKVFLQVLLKLAYSTHFSDKLNQESLVLFKDCLDIEKELGYQLEDMIRRLR